MIVSRAIAASEGNFTKCCHHRMGLGVICRAGVLLSWGYCLFFNLWTLMFITGSSNSFQRNCFTILHLGNKAKGYWAGCIKQGMSIGISLCCSGACSQMLLGIRWGAVADNCYFLLWALQRYRQDDAALNNGWAVLYWVGIELQEID